MATTGLSGFVHADFDEDKKTYAKPAKLAGAIEFKEALDRNDAKLYADKELKDSYICNWWKGHIIYRR